MSKHITNDSKSLVSDSLKGLAHLNQNITFSKSSNSVFLNNLNKDHVSLICGGGAGHEPGHVGYVGEGMLSAAVSGQVFASPNSRQVEDTLARLSFTKGTLIIVKNYTGDVIQFGLAKERWNATHGSSSVRMIIVGDDVSVPRSQGVLTGRRGLAGTVLVYKLAGALAATGATLDEVEFLAKLAAERCGTIGVGLNHCSLPGTKSEQERYLKEDEVEIGMGIHNEPGHRKISPIPSTQSLIDQLLLTITDTSDPDRSFVPFAHGGKDHVVLLVNNLGGLPEIELGAVVSEACSWLASKRITVERVLAGTYLSSLSLPGFSLTLLLLPREPIPVPPTFESKLKFDKELMLDCLDKGTEAPGWKWFYKGRPEGASVEVEEEKVKKGVKKEEEEQVKLAPTDSKVFLKAIQAAIKNLIAAEPEITQFDTIGGDGDAGLTLKSGAEGVEAKMTKGEIDGKDVVRTLVAISEVAEREMGGTSGGLYSIFFAALSEGLGQAKKEKGGEKATAEIWSRGLDLALNSLYVYTRARPPSRTLVDPLSSFILTFSADPSDFLSAFKAANDAAEATRNLDALAGRAAYVDKGMLEKANVPDAGAWGVLKILEGIKSALG